MTSPELGRRAALGGFFATLGVAVIRGAEAQTAPASEEDLIETLGNPNSSTGARVIAQDQLGSLPATSRQAIAALVQGSLDSNDDIANRCSGTLRYMATRTGPVQDTLRQNAGLLLEAYGKSKNDTVIHNIGQAIELSGNPNIIRKMAQIRTHTLGHDTNDFLLGLYGGHPPQAYCRNNPGSCRPN